MFLRKAQGDLALLEEIWDSRRVQDEVVGFHCQQAAEKLLKALLSEHGVAFARTHNLRVLMDLLSDAGQPLPPDLGEIDALTPFGTIFGYEDIPSQATFDRRAAQKMLVALRELVEGRIRP